MSLSFPLSFQLFGSSSSLGSTTITGTLTVSGQGTIGGPLLVGGGANSFFDLAPAATGGTSNFYMLNAAATDYDSLNIVAGTTKIKYRTGAGTSADGITVTTATGAVTIAQALTVSGSSTLGAGGVNNGSRVNMSGDCSGGVASLDLIDTSAGSGSQFACYIRRNSSTIVGSISTTNAATAFNTSCDAHLKIDNGLANDLTGLRNLEIHDFTWKSGGLGRGVFAQDAYKWMPLAITPGKDELNEDGTPKFPWQADYSKMVPDLVVGWQQHDARIASLEAKIARLEALLLK